MINHIIQPARCRHGAVPLALLAMIIALFGNNAVANTLNGEWLPMGGLRNGCDQAGSIEEAVALPDGDLLVIGNILQCVDTAIPRLAGMARFDVQSGEWLTVPGFVRSSAENRLYRVGNRVFVTSANNPNRIEAADLPQTHILQLDLDTGVWSIPGGGVNGGIRDMVSDGHSLFVGGSFSQAGGQPAQRLARYDLATETWHALGGGANSTVNALALSDDWLYAAGWFSEVNGIPANLVGRMRRSTGEWMPLGTGLGSSGRVNTLAINGNTLYAAGTFSPYGSVAAWVEQGNSWTTIGRPGALSTFYVGKLLVHSSVLYGVNGASVARWGTVNPGDSPTWISVGGVARFATTPASLGIHAHEDHLYLFGNMWRVDGLRANGIARHDLSFGNWHPLGHGTSQGVTMAEGLEMSRIRNLTPAGNLLAAGGYFEEIGGVYSDGFAAWDGSAWVDLSGDWDGDARPYRVNGVLPLDDDQILVSGNWAPTSSSLLQDMARCQLSTLIAGQPCISVAGGTNGSVNAMLRLDETTVLMGGSFTQVGHRSSTPLQANRLAQYSLALDTWSTFGAGVEGSAINAMVRHGNDVYVGGDFDAIDGVPVKNIARLDLTTGTWHPLGGGVTGTLSNINQIAIINGEVYAGGRFSSAGGVSARNIARWSPTSAQWTALDGGIDHHEGVISLYADGHLLYVGGYFERANGFGTASIPAQRIAAWDTQTNRWRALPEGGVQTRLASARVSSIARYGNAIYLGGGFSDAGNMASRHFAGFIWAPDPLIFESSFETQ